MKRLAILSLFLFGNLLFAESITFTDSVRVIQSEPVYRTVVKRKPYQECWEEEVPVSYNEDYYERDDSSNVGALIGGAAGGILGHQIGKGHGKDAATIGGAIIGTLIGQNMAKTPRYHNEPRERYKIVRRCKTKYIENEEERITRYKNIAIYKGHRIVKYSTRPLRRIPITVTIRY